MPEINLPIMTWQEFNALRHEAKANKENSDFSVPFDWGTLPIVDMGSKDTAGKLVNTIMARYPERHLLADGRVVQMEFFEQRDMNANRLTGFLQHPSHYVNESIAQLHQKWEWSKGHIVVLVPHLLGGMTLAMDSNKNKVNAQCASLPPIESIAVLNSGPLEKDDDRSSIILLWYQTHFGLDPEIRDKIKHIDWVAHAYSYEF